MELDQTRQANPKDQWVLWTLVALIGVMLILRISMRPAAPRSEAAVVSASDTNGRIAYSHQTSCYAGGITSCSAYFPAIPAKKKLVIEHAAITVETNTKLKAVSFYGDRIENVPVESKGRNHARNSVYATDLPLEAQVKAGEQPNFKVAISNGPSAFSNTQIKLSGYLIDADPSPGG